jgi:hypothetical protein
MTPAGSKPSPSSDEFVEQLYDELHRLAARAMGREKVGHTLQPTALINEAWMRLADQCRSEWESPSHYKALAEDALQLFGLIRFPLQIPVTPGPWLQVVTTSLAPFLLHNTDDRSGLAAWVDPNGFAPGLFNVPPFVGSTIHFPTANNSVWNMGFPIGFSFASSPLEPPFGPIIKGPGGRAAPSTGTGIGGGGFP